MLKKFIVRKLNERHKETETHHSRKADVAVGKAVEWLKEADCLSVTLVYPSKADRAPYGDARDGQIRCNVINGWFRINHSWHPTFPEDNIPDRKLIRLKAQGDGDGAMAHINRMSETRDRKTQQTYQYFRSFIPYQQVHICSLFSSHNEDECALASKEGRAVTSGISRR